MSITAGELAGIKTTLLTQTCTVYRKTAGSGTGLNRPETWAAVGALTGIPCRLTIEKVQPMEGTQERRGATATQAVLWLDGDTPLLRTDRVEVNGVRFEVRGQLPAADAPLLRVDVAEVT